MTQDTPSSPAPQTTQYEPTHGHGPAIALPDNDGVTRTFTGATTLPEFPPEPPSLLLMAAKIILRAAGQDATILQLQDRLAKGLSDSGFAELKSKTLLAVLNETTVGDLLDLLQYAEPLADAAAGGN